MFSVLISSIAALPCELSDNIGTCQPNQERALIFKFFRAVASNAEVICSPVDKTTSYYEKEGVSDVVLTKSIK